MINKIVEKYEIAAARIVVRLESEKELPETVKFFSDAGFEFLDYVLVDDNEVLASFVKSEIEESVGFMPLSLCENLD